MKDKIVALLKETGPIVPSEITGKLNISSVIVSALLSELIKEGVVFISTKKIGSSPLYYLKGQEDAARKRLLPELGIVERKALDFFAEKKLALKDNLSPQQRFIVDNLKDFITKIDLTINGEEKVFYKHYSIPSSVIYDELKSMTSKPKVKTAAHKAGVQESLFAPKTEALTNAKFDDATSDFFKENGMTVVRTDVVKKGSEANFIARTSYNIPQSYFVKYFRKKSLNDNDISKAYAESQVNKMPCLIITKGKLSRKAEKFLVNLGSLVNIVKL